MRLCVLVLFIYQLSYIQYISGVHTFILTCTIIVSISEVAGHFIVTESCYIVLSDLQAYFCSSKTNINIILHKTNQQHC